MNSLLKALLTVFAFGASSALASPGAIWTTYPDGRIVNGNIYDFKSSVYLNGGPQNANGQGIPKGIYYFQVVDPSGSMLLSEDDIECRKVEVNAQGVIAGAVPGPCAHANGPVNPANGATGVQLMPFINTPNSGGEYKVELTPVESYGKCGDRWGFCDKKSDNFKVAQPAAAYVVACKYNDMSNNGVQDVGEPVLPYWPVTATGVDGGTVSAQMDGFGCYSFKVSTFNGPTVDGFPTAAVTVTEGTLGAHWVQTAPANGTRARAGLTPAYTVTNGVVSTVDLRPGDIWDIDFGNHNPDCVLPNQCGTGGGRGALIVTKDANPSYKVTWGIKKSVKETEIRTSGTANPNYTVTLTRESESEFIVRGTIQLSNPTIFDVVGVTVTDAVDNGGSCTVTGGSDVVVFAGDSVRLPYECTYSQRPAAGLNVATATWFDRSGTQVSWGDAGVDFDSPTATVVDGTVNVTDSMAGALGTVKHTDPSPKVFEYSPAVEGTPGTCESKPNTATFTSTTEKRDANGNLLPPTTGSASASVRICTGKNLTVEKTARTSFKRTYAWSLAKTVKDPQAKLASGDATFEYTVTATQTGFTDSGWSATGKITVHNPNDWEDVEVSVGDTVNNGGTCTIDGGTTSLTVPMKGSASVTYTCAYANAPSSTSLENTATVTWSALTYYTPGSSATGKATAGFDTPTSTENKTITVTDVFDGGTPTELGTAMADDSQPTVKEFKYERKTTGTPGTCVDRQNTATFTSPSGLTGSASKTVSVCMGKDLTVTKTVVTSFKRSYEWTITKTVDQEQKNISTGSATFNYTATATQTGLTDSDWKVTGTITVSNPNDWQDVEVTVSDALNIGGTCTIDGSATLTVLRNKSATANYTCTAPSGGKFDNTARASWSPAAYFTPSGSASSPAMPGDFGSTPTTRTNQTITVSDAFDNGAALELGTVTANDSTPYASKSFPYSQPIAGSAGTCVPKSNVAILTNNDSGLRLSASKIVKVCMGKDLTVSKTVATSFKRTYLWTITKTVDQEQKNISTGSATFNYTATATQTGLTDSDWKVTGTITVTNPNDWQDVEVTVSDALSIGGTCTIDGSAALTVIRNTSATANYTCTAPSGGAFNNTAKASWSPAAYFTPSGSASSPAMPGDFGSTPTRTNQTITVSDAFDNGAALELGTVTANDSTPYASKSFPYSQPIAGSAGTCVPKSNVAILTNNDSGLRLSASKTVKVCMGKDLKVHKTAVAAYTRTYLWKIAKSADNTWLPTQASSYTVNYTVAASANGFSDSGWQVTGFITIENPNDWQAVTASVSDVLNGTMGCTVTGGPSVSIDASKSVTLPYTCALTGPVDFTNRATATWDKDRFFTSGSIAWGEVLNGKFAGPTAAVNETVTVTDTMGSEPTRVLGILSAVNGPSSLEERYSRTLAPPTEGCLKVNNTARVVGTNESASVTVTTCGIGHHTMGFWQNKNGQAVIRSAAPAALGGWLQQFHPFSDASTTNVAKYVTDVIKAASCTNASKTCNSMLKAQMLATALTVYFSDDAVGMGGNLLDLEIPLGGLTISLMNPQNVSGAFNNLPSMSVMAMLLHQNTANPVADGGTNWYLQEKSMQVLAKDAFDNINNGRVSPP